MIIGCGRGAGGRSGDNYPIEISVYTQDAFPQPGANNKIYAYLKEKLNVTFTFDILVGDAVQRRGVMVAGGVYPDILHINETFFIDQGAVIPLEALIEQYAPNIKAHYADVWEQMKSPDGHIYHLVDFGIIKGRDQDPNFNGSAFWTQKDVLKDAGYPKGPFTVEQYFNMIEAYARKYPTINGATTIPFTFLTYDWRAFEMWNPPNFLAGNPNEGNGVVDRNNYTYKNFFTMDMSKRWFQLLNGFDKRNLVDRTTFTDNYDQYMAKVSSGRVLAHFGQQWQWGDAERALRDSNQGWRTYAPVPVVFDSSIRPWYRDMPYPNIGRGIGISVSAKDPVRIMRFLNEYITEEIQRTLQWGIEGQDWQRDAQGTPYRTQQQRDDWRNQQWIDNNRARIVFQHFPKIQGSFSDGSPVDLSNLYSEREAMIDDWDKEIFAAYGVTSWREFVDSNPPPNPGPWYPTWNKPNPPDGSDAQIALQRQEQLRKQRLPAMILAAPGQFEGLWNQYVRDSNDAGIATYEAYMQGLVDDAVRAAGRTVPNR
jgi:putative aldouronate transport system substrate-binding protein